MATDTAHVLVKIESPILSLLQRVSDARMAFMRERGKVPALILLGRMTYLALRSMMPWKKDGQLLTLYGMPVVVIPLEDACVCVDENDEEALR